MRAGPGNWARPFAVAVFFAVIPAKERVKKSNFFAV
jgi:hypothetical protein